MYYFIGIVVYLIPGVVLLIYEHKCCLKYSYWDIIGFLTLGPVVIVGSLFVKIFELLRKTAIKGRKGK